MSRSVLAALALVIAVATLIAFVFLRAERVRLAEMQSSVARAEAMDAQALERMRKEVAQIPSAAVDSRSEPEAQPAPLANKSLELLVISSDGVPVAAARLAIFSAETLLASGVTDERGLAVFAAAEGSAQVAVFAPGWAVACATIELEAGRHNVTLADGAILGGWVLVDGALPTEPIEIQFETTKPSKGMASIPKSVLEWLRPALMAHHSQFAISDAKGAFAIRGLAADAAGEISWAGAFVLEKAAEGESDWETTTLEVPALRPDLELRLSLGVELRLRVVDAAGQAVPSATVNIESVRASARGYSQSMFRDTADEAGRYRRPLGRTPPTELNLGIARRDGSGETKHHLVSSPGTRGAWDVGDLALVATRAVTMHIQDGDGAPIKGALTTPLPSSASSKARSDVNGDVFLEMGPDDDKCMAQALGYESAIVAVPLDAIKATATLTRACLLEFTLPAGDEIDLRPLHLTVLGDPPIFMDDGRASKLLQAGGSTSRDMQDQGTASYGTSAVNSRWSVAGLKPGIALRAELTAGNGPVLSQVDVAPLARGEHRSIELVMNRRPKSLRVHVLDPERRPLPAAQVRLSDALRRSTTAWRADPSGTCVLESLYADRLTLTIVADDFPPKTLYGVSIPPDEISVVLERPRSLEIELVTPDGSLVEGDSPLSGNPQVRAGARAESMQAGKPTAKGRWTVSGLPAGEVLIEVATVYRPVQSQLHDTAEPFVRIIVGQPGSVHAIAVVPKDPPAGEWSIAISPESNAGPESRVRVSFKPNGSHDAWFNGLALGSHTVWLETRTQELPGEWTRVGAAMRVTLDGAHPAATVELHP